MFEKVFLKRSDLERAQGNVHRDALAAGGRAVSAGNRRLVTDLQAAAAAARQAAPAAPPRIRPRPPRREPRLAATPGTTEVGGCASAPVTIRAATAETSVVIESDLYHVEISNRGGVVRSWQLKQFDDDNKPPRTLDLVHPDAAQQSGSWPFSLALDDPQQEMDANNALFEVTSGGKPVAPGAVLQAPAEMTLAWSDGHLEITKQLKFDASYIVGVKTSATLDGAPLRNSIIWSGGFGDITAYRAACTDADLHQRRRKTQHAGREKSGPTRADHGARTHRRNI